MFEVRLDPGQTLEGAQDGRLQCQNGGCPHLSQDLCNRCQVYPQRPTACQDFPFQAVDCPGGRFIGASFACTAIQEGLGPALTADNPTWNRLHGHRFQPDLVCGTTCHWDVYCGIEEYVADQLCFPDGAFTAALSLSLGISRGQSGQWQSCRLQWLSENLEATCQQILRGLLALSEAENDPERARQVLVGQASGTRYYSRIFPGWVEPQKIRQQMQEDSEQHWGDVEGFFRHLLFRKFLWGAPSVHARVCLLPLLNEMIRFWTWQQALQRQTTPNQSLRREAIRELERRLTFHATGWEDYIRPLSTAFLEGVG